jgi:hypothetical protein
MELRGVSRHATGFIREWLSRPENADIRAKITRFRGGGVADPGTVIRMAIMEQFGTLPVPPGDRMEFLVQAIQTFFAVVDWVEVDDHLKRTEGS